jgi:tetratricopeptide (TPR) repeat protein
MNTAAVTATTQKIPKKAGDVQPDILPLPDQPHTPAKDLLLKPEAERRADALARFVDGSIAEDNADADKALEDYRKVLEVDPAAKVRADDGNDTMMLLSAKVAFELARRGNPAAGIDMLKDTIQAAPKEPMAYYFLAQLYSKFLKKYDIALKYAGQALDLDPDNEIFYLTNYELELNLGQNKKAGEMLDRASKLQNDDPQFWLKLGELKIQASVKEDGSSAPDDLKKMNALFQKALSFAKNEPGVIAKAADFYVLTKQVKEAIPLYIKVLGLKSDPNDPALDSVREKLANSFVATGQRDEAIKMLQELIKNNPMNYASYELLGQLFEANGENEKALANYQQTLLLSPGDWRNYLRTAGVMFEMKKLDAGVDLLREARKKFPEVPQVTFALAQGLGLAKKNQEALTTFDEAFHEAETSESEMLTAEFYFEYGAAAEQAGMIQKAVELFKKSIALDPANAAKACNYLGFMWVDRGQNLEEAGKMIKRALELDPDNPAYIDSLGWYYYKKNEPEQALVELLKAAASLKPEDAVVYEHVGDTYNKLGNTAQALVYWQKAAALVPDNKAIADKIEGAREKVTSAPSPLPVKSGDHP